MGADSLNDSGIDEIGRNGNNDNNTDDDESNRGDNISITSGNRLKGSKINDTSTKTPSANHHQQHLPTLRSTLSWSPPPPISFRSDQQQQQQHKVTHGPGGKHQ